MASGTDYKASDVAKMLVANGWNADDAQDKAQEIVRLAGTDSYARTLIGRAIRETNPGKLRSVAEPGSAEKASWFSSVAAGIQSVMDQIEPAGNAGNVDNSSVDNSSQANEDNRFESQASPVSQVEAVTNTVTTSGGGGGGSTTNTQVAVDPDGYDPEIDKAEESYIRENYPSLAHWLDHPEVGPLIRQASEEGWTESKLAAKLEPTDWYQSTSSSEREFVNRYNRNPGELQRDIDQQRYMLESVARTQGITMSDEDLEFLATDVIKYGYSEQEILRQLGTRMREQDTGSSDGLLNIEQQLRSMAKQYQLKFDDATLKEYAVRIFEGTWSQDAARATFQQQATQFYPHLADQLEKGVTVEDYFAPIKSRVASILEMNPNDIDMSEGKWASLGQFVDDKGRMRAPTFAEIDQFARNQDEYGYTKQGITSGYEKMNSMFRTLGVIK